jgi:hypothetical protein
MKTGLYVLRTTFPIVGIENPVNTPAKITLRQNYPNPFNPVTTIEYDVPKGNHVKIVVYDVNGRQVGILADDYKPAGSYRINYDASHLSSGIYYYTIISENYRQTRKMVLLK